MRRFKFYLEFRIVFEKKKKNLPKETPKNVKIYKLFGRLKNQNLCRYRNCNSNSELYFILEAAFYDDHSCVVLGQEANKL